MEADKAFVDYSGVPNTDEKTKQNTENQFKQFFGHNVKRANDNEFGTKLKLSSARNSIEQEEEKESSSAQKKFDDQRTPTDFLGQSN